MISNILLHFTNRDQINEEYFLVFFLVAMHSIIRFGLVISFNAHLSLTIREKWGDFLTFRYISS